MFHTYTKDQTIKIPYFLKLLCHVELEDKYSELNGNVTFPT